MSPIFRVVYHTGETLLAESRIACGRHMVARENEIIEQTIDATEDTDLFCEDCARDVEHQCDFCGAAGGAYHKGLDANICESCVESERTRRSNFDRVQDGLL